VEKESQRGIILGKVKKKGVKSTMIIIHDAGCFPRIFEIHLIEVKLFFSI
jgi:hypothetical protein